MRRLRSIKLDPRLQGAIWFCAIMFFLSVMFTTAFVVSGWLYQLTGHTPSPLVVQLVNSLGGIFLTGTVITILSRFFKTTRISMEMRLFGPIIATIERIAQGDFSARIDKLSNPRGNEGAIVDLVQSVNKMATELDQMEMMRQEFISNVSHEIQSPLTSIRGFVQALHNEHLTVAEKNHYLTIIETESTRISKLTENLLKLASLEAEHVRFEPKPYRLDRQIRDLILACEPQWLGKNIEMDAALTEVMITADEDLMSQVWVNLLHNSIKFTPTGGKISVQLGCENGQVQFKIVDSGAGISEEDQLHIFERFYKADKSRTRSDVSGSGLGLSIAQKIVDMHHGTIAVASQPNDGTTFTVSLPEVADVPASTKVPASKEKSL